jgi:methionine-S-sulfoxide reductase
MKWSLVFAALWLGLMGVGLAAEPVPAKVAPMSTTNRTELATLGGGCFWCLEAVFERLPGVNKVVSGYAGGRTENPTYREVCHTDTGHAEVVQIEFNPAVLSFEQLLEVFWVAHDPTTPNRQGADVGTQYRSIILTHSPEQWAAAERSKAAANLVRKGKVVTEIVPLKKFYLGEEYHQDYFKRHPDQPYCQAVIAPKLLKLEEHGTVPKR